jgi:hypothetical protein
VRVLRVPLHEAIERVRLRLASEAGFMHADCRELPEGIE